MRIPRIVAVAACCIVSIVSSLADMPLTERTKVRFATAEAGGGVLGSKDDFVERLSPFDRSAPFKTETPLSTDEYLQWARKNTVEWTDAEKSTFTSILEEFPPSIRELGLKLPELILLVKTTGIESSHAPYTRANAIVFPVRSLQSQPAQLKRILCHELFHVLSRANPELRDRLYAVIGFHRCDEVRLPEELEYVRITNPDAPVIEHYIEIVHKGEKHGAVPVIFSGEKVGDGEFLKALKFQLLLVKKEDGSAKVTPLRDDSGPVLIEAASAGGFFEQIGKNTWYIIHPEEILAENFVHLVMGSKKLSSPEIVQKVKAELVR